MGVGQVMKSENRRVLRQDGGYRRTKRILNSAAATRRSAFALLTILLALVLLAPGVQAQTPSIFPLRPGTVEGNINDNVPSVHYSFDAKAGESVTITMETTSGDLDPLLVLYDSGNNQIERNDDRESGDRNAEIVLTLSRGGTYVIEATRFETGNSSGTFRLTLAVAGTDTAETSDNPLDSPPVFGVTFTTIAYQDVVSGQVTPSQRIQYYAVGAQQGDLVRIIMTRTSSDLEPSLRVLNNRGEDLSRESQSRAGESIAYVTFPETGWYLIEAGGQEGSGTYDLYLNRLADAVLQVGQAITNTFVPQTPSLSYIINARFGDLITLNMFATDAASGVQPGIELLDLSLNVLEHAEGARFATLRTTIPRSAPYIVRVTNLRSATTGNFNLRLTSVPADISTLAPVKINYNSQKDGEITDTNPLAFYRFSGKTGELVTISMARQDSDLDSFLILMDSDLNELASNNDAGVDLDARITQFRLPKDGVYIILASRAGLTTGSTTGAYRLSLTAGEIALEDGVFGVTLTWTGVADLNLLVRDPSGRIVTWSSPESPTGGHMQIDSNTGCQTPSDQPVEHIYWDRLTPGNYAVWAWYQDGCGRTDTVPYRLVIRSGGEDVATESGTLAVGQRLELPLRVVDDGRTVVLDSGTVTQPSPQQRASEGGDVPIRFGDTLVGTLDDQVYARFYRFTGDAGARIRIDAQRASGDLDLIVVLRDADNNNLPDAINDDNDDTTTDARLDYTLPSSGEYVIAVTRYGVRDGTTSGDFNLTLSQLSP